MRSMYWKLLEVDPYIQTSPSSFYHAFVFGEEKLSPLSPLLLDLILVDTCSSKEVVPEGSGSMTHGFAKVSEFQGPIAIRPWCI